MMFLYIPKVVLCNILLGIVSICTIISYIPQLIRLLVTKSSEDISITSWILWIIIAISYLVYSLLVGDFMLIVSSILEFVFCLVIIVLTIVFKRRS